MTPLSFIHRIRHRAFLAAVAVLIACTGDRLLVPLPAPTLATLNATLGVQGTTIPITLSGTNFLPGATSVSVTGAGVAVGTIDVTSPTSLTTSFTIAAGAALGNRTVTVATAAGNSEARSFVINPPTPALAAIAPSSVVQGATQSVTLTGTNFVPGATTVAVSGSDLTVTNVSVASATSLTADIAAGAAAAVGARDVTVTTVGGTSGTQSFTIVSSVPTLASLSPASGGLGAAVSVTLTGTNFVAGSTTVAVSGSGVTVSGVSVTSATSLQATFTVSGSAALGGRDVTVTTPNGTSGAQTFTVSGTAPTFTNIAPAVGIRGTTQAVTLTGTNFIAAATTVNVSGANVTVSNVSVTSSTSLTADFAIAAGAAIGARNVTVTTGAGTSGSQSFTIHLPLPSLTGLSLSTGAQTGTQTLTLTGTNFEPGGTTIDVSGTNVTVSNVNVTSGTTLTADFAVAGGAALGARNVTVTTAGGTTGAQTFTVVVPPTIDSFNALATRLFAAQPARLRWAVSNAATCSINQGVGAVASCTDSLFVTPGTTKTYTLSATSAGATVTANFQLFANEPGRFVYSTSSGGAVGTHVHQHSLNAGNGDITAIGGGNVAAGATTLGITVDPSGRYAYAVNSGADNVSMYSIDATTGALTSLGTQAAGNVPREIAIDPTGRFVYVVNANSGVGAGSVSRYTVDGTGVLVANGTSAVGNEPRGIAIDGTGRFLYVTNRDDRTISQFSINADGTLTSLGTTAAGPLATERPYFIAADPTGRFAYVTHDVRGRYSMYRIETNGTLTALAGSPVDIGPGTIRAVAVDPTGRFVYIVDFNNSILHEFTIDQATGILTRFAAPTLPHTLATTQTIETFAIDPQGKFAYATDSNNGNIITFAIDANGVLSPVAAPLRLLAAGTNPYGIVVSR